MGVAVNNKNTPANKYTLKYVHTNNMAACVKTVSNKKYVSQRMRIGKNGKLSAKEIWNKKCKEKTLKK